MGPGMELGILLGPTTVEMLMVQFGMAEQLAGQATADEGTGSDDESGLLLKEEAAADEEVVMLMETPAALADAAVARLRDLHPYDVPKILTLTPDQTDPDYLTWLQQVTTDRG